MVGEGKLSLDGGVKGSSTLLMNMRNEGDGWICSTCLGEFLRKMMKLLKVLLKTRNAYGWMNLEGGCLL